MAGSSARCFITSFTVMSKASGKKFYLFLPASADRSAVTLRYDGKLKAYDDITNTFIQPGETFVADLTEETVNLYEYDPSYEVYNAYTVHVMKGGDIASVYITLRNGDDSLLKINSSQSAVESGTIRMTESDGKLIYDGVRAGTTQNRAGAQTLALRCRLRRKTRASCPGSG